MASRRVKLKFANRLPLALAGLALGSFFASWVGLLPGQLVEIWYARKLFPIISSAMTPVGRLIGGSVMDLILPGAILLISYLAYRRRPLAILGLLSSGYLIFFWTWGLNYHRQPLETKLDFETQRVTEDAIAALVEEAAAEINRAYGEVASLDAITDEAALVDEADARVRSVIEIIDGVPPVRGNSPIQVKTSRLLNPFFRAGTVDGMFNPFGHEALVMDGLLRFERPMVVLHEIAHVRGYAHEGEANFIAFIAAIYSEDPRLRYSGWLSLWRYLGSRENDVLLDPGPLTDLDAVDQRIRGNRVEWVSRTQSRTLDAFLKVNRVDSGIRSYSEIVTLVVGTRHDWDRFGDRGVRGRVP